MTDPSHQPHSRFIYAQHFSESGGDRPVQSFFWENPCHERLMIQGTPDMALQAVAQRNSASFTHPSCSVSVPDLRLRDPAISHTVQGQHHSWEVCKNKCSRWSPKPSRHFNLHANSSQATAQILCATRQQWLWGVCIIYQHTALKLIAIKKSYEYKTPELKL